MARNSGKNLGAPMQKYVYIGGGKGRVDTRESWREERRGRLTWMASGV